MKKILAGLVAASALAGSVNAGVDLACVDYDKLYVDCKEGKTLEREKERQMNALRKVAMEEQQKLSLKEQQISQKMYEARNSSENDMSADSTKDIVAFETAKVDAQSKIKKLELELELFKSREKAIRAKADSAVDSYRKDNKLAIIIASNYPGVKADASLDKTSDVLKLLDKRYDTELAKSAISDKKEIKSA